MSGVALIYTRVSGPGQEKDGASLELQEEACRTLASERGYTVGAVVREVYRGAELFDRPQMTQVRADLRARRYAALIVWTTSRLARNPVHQAIIIEEAMRGGAVVEIVNEPLDTSPEGLLIAYVRGYAAQIDRERIRAQTLGGRRRRLESGKIHNVGVDLYGYRRDREVGVRLIYEPEAAIVRRIYDWCVSEHRGIRTIARLLNEQGIPPPDVGKRERARTSGGLPIIWHSSTVRNILRNSAYRGETLVWRTRSEVVTSATAPTRRSRDPQQPPRTSQYQNKPRPAAEYLRLPDGVTPAIVSAETWYAAQLALDLRLAQRGAQATALPYLLTGCIRCSVCGRAMEAHTDRDKRHRIPTARRTYRCASHQAPEGSCHASRIAAEALETWVWDETRAILRDGAVLRQEASQRQGSGRHQHSPERSDDLTAERERTAAALARVERLQSRTLARYNTVDDEALLPWSVVQSELARLDTEKALHTKRLAELDAAHEAQQMASAHRATLRAEVAEYTRLLDADDGTIAYRRELLERLNVRVVGSGAMWSLYLEVIAGDEATPVLRVHQPPETR